MELKKAKSKKKEINIKGITTYEATAQVLAKARCDNVEAVFDRAANMKACPIGGNSSCCIHFAIRLCRKFDPKFCVMK